MSTLLEAFKTMDYGPAPESPAAVNAWLDEHGRRFGLFINNQWITPKDAKTYRYTIRSNAPALDGKSGERLPPAPSGGSWPAIPCRSSSPVIG